MNVGTPHSTRFRSPALALLGIFLVVFAGVPSFGQEERFTTRTPGSEDTLPTGQAPLPEFAPSFPEPSIPLVNGSTNFSLLSRFKNRLRKDYVRPTKQEAVLGSVAGLYQTTTAGSFWLTSDIPLWAAGTIALGMGTRTWLKAVYLQTFDNLMSANPASKKWGPFQEMVARQGENLLFLELWRLLSGPVGQSPSAFTLAGQLDLIAYLAIVGTAGNFGCMCRKIALSPAAKMWMGFNGFLVGAALRAAEQAGARGPTLLDLGFFKLSTILGIMIAQELVVGSLIRTFPKPFEKITGFQTKFARKTEGLCKRALGRLSPKFQKSKTQ